MEKTIKGIIAAALMLFITTPALGNTPGGGYEGITGIYYSFIALILGYGAYDIFFKKE